MVVPARHRTRTTEAAPSIDWTRLYFRAGAALARRLRTAGRLCPRATARIVIAAAPRTVGARLYRRLERLGWLDETARLPFDVLERPDCPLRLNHQARRFVRLALFGLPGQGHTTDFKQREAIFEQRCAEIMRETRDLESLAFAASRALGHPAVRSDPELAGMLRGFISQRESELREKQKELHPEEETQSKLEHAFEQERNERLAKEKVKKALIRLRLRMEEHLAHYNDTGAKRVLREIQALQKRHPQHVEPSALIRCEAKYARLLDRLKNFREQLGALTQQGYEAAQAGDQDRALWISRRLDAVNALLPDVLPDDKFKQMQNTITQCVENFENQQVASQILAQERTVAAEIKQLGAIVHRFHKLAHDTDRDADVFQQAKAAYEQAVRQIRKRDKEWLASLMMRLDSFLEDLDDPQGNAATQVDRFLESVRAALVHIRTEVKSMQAE